MIIADVLLCAASSVQIKQNAYRERRTEISIKVNGSGIPRIIIEFFQSSI